MTTEEFSNEFDILMQSMQREYKYGSTDILACNEYEKSIFLTQSQEKVIISLYNGKNPFRDSFESSEENTKYLDFLVKDKSIDLYNIAPTPEAIYSDTKGKHFRLMAGDDVMFIVQEYVKCVADIPCMNGTSIPVVPTSHDELYNIIRDPFRGIYGYTPRCLRIDIGKDVGPIVEVIVNEKYTKQIEDIRDIENPKVSTLLYNFRYIKKPNPIILVDLPDGLTINGKSNTAECEMPEILHRSILADAVAVAIQVKSLRAPQQQAQQQQQQNQ